MLIWALVKCPLGGVVNATNFRSQDPGLESRKRWNLAHASTALYYSKPFIITLKSSQCALNTWVKVFSINTEFSIEKIFHPI